MKSLLPEIAEFRDETYTPEQSLIASILTRAWADLSSNNRFIQNDAWYWITSKKDFNVMFSFCWCCAMLEKDPTAIRERMTKDPFYFGEIRKNLIRRKNSIYNS